MRPREKGSAVITVVLVVLVLTMVGLASLIYMSLEQNLTLADRLAKEALYMSEAGLRVGEVTIATTSLGDMNLMLSFAPTYPAWSKIPPTTSDCDGTQYPGAILKDLTSGTVYHAFKPAFYTAPTGYYAVYSLYIRNNQDDPSGSPTDDQDNRVRLVCVGEVYKGTPPLASGVVPPGSVMVARKIVEEELTTGVITGYSGQKGGSSGNAGSSFYK
jgi:hypothetical protein